TIPSVSFDLTIPVTSFTASDDMEVTGFMLTVSSSIPPAHDDGWISSPPEEFIFSSEGTYNLFAWVKDSAGNISAPFIENVTVIIPDLSPTFSEYLLEEESGDRIMDSQGSN